MSSEAQYSWDVTFRKQLSYLFLIGAGGSIHIQFK